MPINRKGQSTLEYAIVIAVVIGALLAMQIYMKRGLEGKLSESTDQVGEQFELNKTSVESHSSHTGKTVQTVSNTVTTSATTADVRTEGGREEVENW